jgi:VanZ family protein
MKNRKILIILYLLLLITGSLFFLGGFDYYSPRSYKRIWDQGHVFFYTILCIVLLQSWNFIRNKNCTIQLFWLTLLTILSGSLIELIQIKFARLTELGDLWRDFLGCLFGLSFFSDSCKKISKRYLLIIRLTVILLLIIELILPFTAIVDEIVAKKQFPVLSKFETPFESERWESEKPAIRTSEQVYEGKYACKFNLDTTQYSGFTLRYFPGNWEGYDKLHFALFNPLTSPLSVTCRIHDWEHIQNKEPYQDRFNRRLLLQPGWNSIQIFLEEVKNAPHNRTMNMKQIMNLCIFATRLSQPLEIYIDDVGLN